MKTKVANKFQTTYDKWVDVNSELYQDCNKYLRDVLQKAPDNEIVISEGAEVSVEYNGGNHPEYDSNCFSMVSKVYLKNNNVYLAIEETDEYNIDNLTANALYDVTNAVEWSIEQDYDLED